MNIPSLLNEPWAITPQKLQEMCLVYERHAAGAMLSTEEIQAAIGPKSLTPSVQPGYTVDRGVAVIPVQGVMARKMNLFTQISGGMSTEMLVDTINEALADNDVHSLMLDIDSPGGEVAGTQRVGDAIAGASKPTAAYVNELAASAAYWVAAQCDAIYTASESAQVGSIGVVMSHTDESKANDAAGIKVTHITSGKYKRLTNSDEPLSQDGHEYMQGKVDYLHTLFVDAVAKGRTVTPESLANVAQGQTFYSAQAEQAGLIDGTLSQDQVIQQLAHNFTTRQHTPVTGGSAMSTKTYTEAQYAEAVAAAEQAAKATASAEVERTKAEAVAEMDRAKAEGHKAGADAERARIAAIESTPLAGSYPDVVKQLKADGKSGKAEAALAILDAEAKSRGNAAANITADASAIVVAASAPGATDAADRTGAAKPTAIQIADEVSALVKGGMGHGAAAMSVSAKYTAK